MNGPCCKNCPDRVTGDDLLTKGSCKSTCKAWKEWNKEHLDKKDKVFHEKMKNKILDTYELEKIRKRRKL